MNMNRIKAIIGRARRRRQDALKRGDKRGAQAALRTIRRWRARLKGTCHNLEHRVSDLKGWHGRPTIHPDLIVLHSTESSPGTGAAVSAYLARTTTPADVQVVIDSDGTLYRLVPDTRKAWHVAAYNGRAVGIEQVGRASQPAWPAAQLHAVACQIASWHRRLGIPIRDSRHDLKPGVVTHKSLGVSGGGHVDPGDGYPFAKVLEMARAL